MFIKGESGNPAGRPKGALSKKTLLRAAAVLADKGLSPTEELVKIAQDAATPVATRIELWKFLQSYVEAPQTKPTEIAPETPEGSADNARKTMALLASLAQPRDPGNPPAPDPQR